LRHQKHNTSEIERYSSDNCCTKPNAYEEILPFATHATEWAIIQEAEARIANPNVSALKAVVIIEMMRPDEFGTLTDDAYTHA